MSKFLLGVLLAVTTACGTLEVSMGARQTVIGEFQFSLTYDPSSGTVTAAVPSGSEGQTVTFQPVDAEGNPVGDPITVTPPAEVQLPPRATGVQAVAGDEGGEEEPEVEERPTGSKSRKLGEASLPWSGYWEFPIDLAATTTTGRWYAHLETVGASERESRAVFRSFAANRVSSPLAAPSTGTVDVAFVVLVQATAGGDLVMTFYDDRPFEELTVTLQVNGTATSYDLLGSPGSRANGWYSRSLSVPLAQAGQAGVNRVDWDASVRSKGQRLATGPVGHVEFTLP